LGAPATEAAFSSPSVSSKRISDESTRFKGLLEVQLLWYMGEIDEVFGYQANLNHPTLV
jgi:hypothetical protein